MFINFLHSNLQAVVGVPSVLITVPDVFKTFEMEDALNYKLEMGTAFPCSLITDLNSCLKVECWRIVAFHQQMHSLSNKELNMIGEALGLYIVSAGCERYCDKQLFYPWIQGSNTWCLSLTYRIINDTTVICYNECA